MQLAYRICQPILTRSNRTILSYRPQKNYVIGLLQRFQFAGTKVIFRGIRLIYPDVPFSDMIFIEKKPKISEESVAQSLAPIYSESSKSSRSTSQDIFHSIVKGRKSWKTLHGGEVVWPPQLEEALIEGITSGNNSSSRANSYATFFPLVFRSGKLSTR